MKTVYLLDLAREDVGGRTARDSYYLKSFLEGQGTCQTHTTLIEPIPAEYDPSLFDIGNPSTWPTQEQWPGFDSNNPLTWPTSPVDPPATESPAPSGGELPPLIDVPDQTPPVPTPVQTPVPTATPPGAVETPPSSQTEPYVPADVPQGD